MGVDAASHEGALLADGTTVAVCGTGLDTVYPTENAGLANRIRERGALVSELSRGMRQKVAICCGYLHDPRAILLDEPLTGLDPHGIRTMQASIRRRAEEVARRLRKIDQDGR